ncbi:MAG: thioredoxin [Bacteroidetes bacterium]|nr:thioredoxin [Bacteroidota bacterium]
MKKQIIIAALTTSFFAVSCQSQTGVTHANQINTVIPIEEFNNKLTELKNVQLVDVRTPEEYQEGHLKNALNYDINGSDFESKLNSLDKNKPVLVYCLSGGRSAQAASMMAEKGFAQVYNMKGGMMKWNAANLPTEKGAVAELKKGLSLDDFNKKIASSQYTLVDFNAKWCAPCKKMMPMFERLEKEKASKLSLFKIDADENKELMKTRGISAIPYLELYKNGKLLWKHEGEIDEPTFLKETGL